MIDPKRKIVICFSSHSCTGKTKTANMIFERNPGMYLVAFDKQKWLLSGYDRTTDSPLIKEITLGLFKVVTEKSLPIILMSPMMTKENYNMFKKVADDNGYEFHSISLTAPHDVLMQRFRERVEKAKTMESKTISVTDEGTFLSNLDRDFYKPEDAVVIDTSVYDPEAVYQMVMEKIGEK